MKLFQPFNLREELAALVIERLPDEEWSPAQLFETIRIASNHFSANRVSRSWISQMYADQLHRVSDELVAGRIDAGSSNRLVLLLLQHLEATRSHRGGLRLLTHGLPAFRRWWPWRSDGGSNPAMVLRELKLEGHALPGLRFVNTTFVNCDFRRADLSGAVFNLCTLSACVFDEAEMSRVTVVRSEVQGCSFRRAAMNQASFSRTRSLGSNFDDALLDGAKGINP